MPDPHGVGMRCEHDGDGLSRLSSGRRLGRRICEDDVDIHANKVGRHFTQLMDCFRPPKFNDNVLAFNITVLTQAGPQSLDPVYVGSGGTKPNDADPRDVHRLLRLC